MVSARSRNSVVGTLLSCSVLFSFGPVAAQEEPLWQVTVEASTPTLTLEGRVEGVLTDTFGHHVQGGARAHLDHRQQAFSLEVQRALTTTQTVNAWVFLTRDTYRFQRQHTAMFFDNQDTLLLEGEGSFGLKHQLLLARVGWQHTWQPHPDTDLAFHASVYAARASLEGNVKVHLSGSYNEEHEAFVWGKQDRLVRTRVAPGIGVSWQQRWAPRLSSFLAVQGFRTNWGPFGDTEGYFLHTTARLGWQATPALTVWAGYSVFDINLGVVDTWRFASSTTLEGIPLGLQGEGTFGMRLKTSGPGLGLTYRF